MLVFNSAHFGAHHTGRDSLICHSLYEWINKSRVMSHLNESCLVSMTYEWDISTSHVSSQRVMSHLNESCLIWTSHVSSKRVTSHLNESCLIWTRHVSHSRTALPAAHLQTSSSYTYKGVTPLVCMGNVSSICLIQMRHDSLHEKSLNLHEKVSEKSRHFSWEMSHPPTQPRAVHPNESCLM